MGIKNFFDIIKSSAEVMGDKVDEFRDDLFEKEKRRRENIKSRVESREKLFLFLRELENEPSNKIGIFIRLYVGQWENKYSAQNFLNKHAKNEIYLGELFRAVYDRSTKNHAEVHNYLQKKEVNTCYLEVNHYRNKKNNTPHQLIIEVFPSRGPGYVQNTSEQAIRKHNELVLFKESSLLINCCPSPELLKEWLPLFDKKRFRKLLKVIDGKGAYLRMNGKNIHNYDEVIYNQNIE